MRSPTGREVSTRDMPRSLSPPRERPNGGPAARRRREDRVWHRFHSCVRIAVGSAAQIRHRGQSPDAPVGVVAAFVLWSDRHRIGTGSPLTENGV